MSDLIQTGFDYAALPVDVALKAQLAANSIKLRLKRTVEDIIEIGRELTGVKADLPHGQFLPWIAAEFEMSRQTADNFESVYARFGKDKVLNFSTCPRAIGSAAFESFSASLCKHRFGATRIATAAPDRRPLIIDARWSLSRRSRWNPLVAYLQNRKFKITLIISTNAYQHAVLLTLSKSSFCWYHC